MLARRASKFASDFILQRFSVNLWKVKFFSLDHETILVKMVVLISKKILTTHRNCSNLSSRSYHHVLEKRQRSNVQFSWHPESLLKSRQCQKWFHEKVLTESFAMIFNICICWQLPGVTRISNWRRRASCVVAWWMLWEKESSLIFKLANLPRRNRYGDWGW